MAGGGGPKIVDEASVITPQLPLMAPCYTEYYFMACGYQFRPAYLGRFARVLLYVPT
jgi:hypothetical protein